MLSKRKQISLGLRDVRVIFIVTYMSNVPTQSAGYQNKINRSQPLV